MAGVTDTRVLELLGQLLDLGYKAQARALRMSQELYGIPAASEDEDGSRWLLRLTATPEEGPAGTLLVEHIGPDGRGRRVVSEHRPRTEGKRARSVRLDDELVRRLEEHGELSSVIREACEDYLRAFEPG